MYPIALFIKCIEVSACSFDEHFIQSIKSMGGLHFDSLEILDLKVDETLDIRKLVFLFVVCV